MPRVEKLVPIEGRIGVILDVPPNETGSVILLTQPEIDGLIAAEREACAKILDGFAEDPEPSEKYTGATVAAGYRMIAKLIRARAKTEGNGE